MRGRDSGVDPIAQTATLLEIRKGKEEGKFEQLKERNQRDHSKGEYIAWFHLCNCQIGVGGSRTSSGAVKNAAGKEKRITRWRRDICSKERTGGGGVWKKGGKGCGAVVAFEATSNRGEQEVDKWGELRYCEEGVIVDDHSILCPNGKPRVEKIGENRKEKGGGNQILSRETENGIGGSQEIQPARFLGGKGSRTGESLGKNIVRI